MIIIHFAELESCSHQSLSIKNVLVKGRYLESGFDIRHPLDVRLSTAAYIGHPKAPFSRVKAIDGASFLALAARACAAPRAEIRAQQNLSKPEKKFIAWMDVSKTTSEHMAPGDCFVAPLLINASSGRNADIGA